MNISKLVFLFLPITIIKSTFANEAVEFDTSILEKNGINSGIVEQLNKEARFLTGYNDVNIYVNNLSKGNYEIYFNDSGHPCFNLNNIKSLGINIPMISTLSKDQCIDILSIWPNSEIIKKPKNQQLLIFLPENAINSNDEFDFSQYKKGGNGAFLNYSSHYMDSNDKYSDDMYYINTELGINLNNWTIKSSQSYTNSSEDKIRHQYAYAQKTFEKYRKNLQIGQINLNNFIGGSKVIGLQLFPETRLNSNSIQGHAIVQGTATESSIVEIYQQGKLIYNTAVPEGDFKLTQFSILNRSSDLKVLIKGVYGAEQEFTVPAATFLRSIPVSSEDLSIGLGFFDEYRAKSNPIVFSMSKAWSINSYLGLQAGTLISPEYYLIGANFSVSLPYDITWTTSNNISYDKNESLLGSLYTTSIDYVFKNFGIGFSTLYQDNKYAWLSEIVNKEDGVEKQNNKQKQFGLNFNWTNQKIGSLGSSLGRSYNLDNTKQDYISMFWSRIIFNNYTINATYTKNYAKDTNNDSFFLRINIPFDKASLSSSFSHSNHSNKLSTRYNNYVSRDRNWGIGYDYNENYQSISTNFSTITPYTQINANLNHTDNNLTSWGTSLNGSISMIKDAGLLLSAYPIKETFGYAKLGERKNIRLETNSGISWTNSKGYAVIPSFYPYAKNSVRVDMRSLSKQEEISNGYKAVLPARGSIIPIHFDLIESRRVMLNVIWNNQVLPENSIVKDEANNFLTIATQPGKLFISNATQNMILNIEMPNHEQCQIQLNLNKLVPSDQYYEEYSVDCLSNKDNLN